MRSPHSGDADTIMAQLRVDGEDVMIKGTAKGPIAAVRERARDELGIEIGRPRLLRACGHLWCRC